MPRRYGLIAFAFAFLYYIALSTENFDTTRHAVAMFAVISHILVGLQISIPEFMNAITGQKNSRRF